MMFGETCYIEGTYSLLTTFSIQVVSLLEVLVPRGAKRLAATRGTVLLLLLPYSVTD